MLDSRIPEHEKRFCEIMQKIDRLYEEFAKSKGLTYMSMTVLETICVHPDDCTQKLISEATHYPKQSVNLIVKSFLDSGYVTLTELPEDRRNKRVALTERGHAFAEETVGELWAIDKTASGQITPRQGEELLRLLTIYTDAYEAGIHKAIR